MSKAKQKTAAASVMQGAKVKAPIAVPTGTNSMINWLAVLLLVLPFLYSEKLLDTAVAIRYIFLCAFILLFVIYFFICQKRSIAISSPLIRIVFITGAGFAIWSLVSLLVAVNYHEGYYEISRH